MVENSYVYSHTRKDNGKCFYIGIGTGNPESWDSRAKNTAARNEAWKQVYTKAGGRNIKILVNGISIDKAKLLERDFISQVGKENLTNKHKGGAGGFSREVCENNSKRLKGKIQSQLQVHNLTRRKPVKVYDLNKNFIGEYESQYACHKALDVNSISIYLSKKTGRPKQGYYFV